MLLKLERLFESLRLHGRAFQIVGAATAKDLPPAEFRLNLGRCSSFSEEDLKFLVGTYVFKVEDKDEARLKRERD